MVEEIWPLAGAKYDEVSERQFKKGFDKYGVPLTTFNGRNPFGDAWEELVDLSQYVTQATREYETLARNLYIFSIVYGFFGNLPDHVQGKLLEMFEGQPLAELCKMEKVNLDASTPKPYGPKTI